MLAKATLPYELLVRFAVQQSGQSGQVAGWHLVPFDGIYEDGALVAGNAGRALGPAAAIEAGWPLDQLLGALGADALTRAETAESERAQMAQSLQAAQSQVAALTAERDALLVQLNGDMNNVPATVAEALQAAQQLAAELAQVRDAVTAAAGTVQTHADEVAQAKASAEAAAATATTAADQFAAVGDVVELAQHAKSLAEAAATTASEARAAVDATAEELGTAVAGLRAVVEEVEPPPINGVPQKVTMRQAKHVMNATLVAPGVTLLQATEAALAAIPGAQGDSARLDWQESTAILRTNPLLAAIKPALGLTDEQLDALFIAAKQIP